MLRLVQLVTDGERWWFGYHVAGDPKWSEVDFSMEVPDDVTPARLLDAFHEAVADSAAIMAGVELDDPLAVLVDGQQLPVRWVVAHKTSEIARHAGHTDIPRELIDGVTGR